MALDPKTKKWLVVCGIIIAAAAIAVIIYFIVVASQNHNQSSSAPSISIQNPIKLAPSTMVTNAGGTTQTLAPVGLSGTATITPNQLTPEQRSRIRDPVTEIAYQNRLAQAAYNLSSAGLSTSTYFIPYNVDWDKEYMAVLPQCTQSPTTGVVTCVTPTWNQSSASASASS